MDKPLDPENFRVRAHAIVAGKKKTKAAPNAAARVRMVNPAEWEGKQAPPRKWIVENYIPDGTVTLLYADGGTGKSYLKLQLAIARAVAREWIGLVPEPGRTLVLSTEDDINEMWRRIEGMLPFFGARMADLGDVRLVDLVGENSVLGLLSKGFIEPTPMYQSLDEFMSGLDISCRFVAIDCMEGSLGDARTLSWVMIAKGEGAKSPPLTGEHDAALTASIQSMASPEFAHWNRAGSACLNSFLGLMLAQPNAIPAGRASLFD